MASAPLETASGSRPRPQRPPPPNLLSSERTTFSHFKSLFNKAHQCVEKGLSLDEENKDGIAKEQYQLALDHIDRAMSMDFELLNFTSSEVETGGQMQQKLIKTRLQVEYRLRAIDTAITEANSYPNLEDRTAIDAPPSYDEATSSSFSSITTDVGDNIMNDDSQHQGLQQHANADRIFEIADGVQIFFITPEGYVSAPSYPSAMSVFKFHEDATDRNQNPPCFLQVNDWIYPLIPGTSPALKTTYGAYMFPDTTSDIQGAAVGLMLPDTMEASEKQMLEDLLRNLTIMEEQQPYTPSPEGASAHPQEPCPAYSQEAPSTHHQQSGHQVQYPQVPTAPEEEMTEPGAGSGGMEGGQAASSTSTKISKGILVAAEWITWGVGKGAEKAGQLIKYGSGKLQTQLSKGETERTIDPKVQKGAKYARQATNAAVKVSGYIVSKLGEATVALGRQAAPHIRKQGEKILPKVFKPSKDGTSKIDGVLEVAASGLKGFSTVFMGLEASAKVLGRNIANETVVIVNHKYGSEAGKFAENTLYSVGNVAMTAYNADNLGVKAIAKRAARDTGKAVLYDLKDQKDSKSGATSTSDQEHRTDPKKSA